MLRNTRLPYKDTRITAIIYTDQMTAIKFNGYEKDAVSKHGMKDSVNKG